MDMGLVQMSKLKSEISVYQTARNSYATALKEELDNMADVWKINLYQWKLNNKNSPKIS